MICNDKNFTKNSGLFKKRKNFYWEQFPIFTFMIDELNARYNWITPYHKIIKLVFHNINP